MKLIAAAAAFIAALQSPQQAPLRPSGIAARINGEIITWDEVELELHSIPAADRTPELRKKTLRRLAEEALFLQEAKSYNIDVPETQVDAVIEQERKAAGMTIEKYQQAVNSLHGIGISEYRAILRRQRMIALLMSRLATEPLRSPNSKLRLLLEFVSPEEMRDYFTKHSEQFKPLRQVDLVFIAFQFGPADRDEKVRLAESVRRRSLEDAPFSDRALFYHALARMDPSLMPVKNNKRQPQYENLSYDEAPFTDDVKKLLYVTLKEGEMSDPVVEENKVTVFQLRRRIVEEARTFEQAQPVIRRHLESAKRRYNQKLLLDDLVRRSFVEPPDLFN
jgi:hypothetical protein